MKAVYQSYNHADAAGYNANPVTYTSWFSYHDESGLAGWLVTMFRTNHGFTVVPNHDLINRASHDYDLYLAYNQFVYDWQCQVVMAELNACVFALAVSMMPQPYYCYPGFYPAEQYETVVEPEPEVPAITEPVAAAVEVVVPIPAVTVVETQTSIRRRLAFGGTISGFIIDQTSGPSVNIPTTQLRVIKTNLSGLLVNHLNSDYFKQYVNAVSASAKDGTHNVSPFVVVNDDLLAHFSEKVWCGLESLLPNGVVNGVVTNAELSARVRVLSWITFGVDTLAPSPSELFASYEDHVSRLRECNVIDDHEYKELIKHVVPEKLRRTLESRSPVDKFRFPAATPVSLRLTNNADARVYSLTPKYTRAMAVSGASLEVKVLSATSENATLHPDAIAVPTPITTTNA